jgi:hypothetical protein
VRLLKILLAATLVIGETGCGLPNPYFLAAPTVPSLAVGGSQVTLVSPGYNQPGAQTTFTGFEIYYKFLGTTPSGTDINLGGGGYPGPSILQQNGYMPICLATDSPPLQRTAPAIAIAFADSTNSLSITLTLSSSGASATNYSPTPPNPPPVLGRNMSYGVSPFTSKTFADNGSSYPSSTVSSNNYLTSDADLQSIVSGGVFTTSNNQAFVNLYVLAYGFEQGTSVVEYSPPTYMGYLTISPFP